MNIFKICNKLNSKTKISPNLLNLLGELLINSNNLNFKETNCPLINCINKTIINLHKLWCHKEYIKYQKYSETKINSCCNESNNEKNNLSLLYDNCMNLILVLTSKSAKCENICNLIINQFIKHLDICHFNCFNYILSMYRLFKTSEIIKLSAKNLNLINYLMINYLSLYYYSIYENINEYKEFCKTTDNAQSPNKNSSDRNISIAYSSVTKRMNLNLDLYTNNNNSLINSNNKSFNKIKSSVENKSLSVNKEKSNLSKYNKYKDDNNYNNNKNKTTIKLFKNIVPSIKIPKINGIDNSIVVDDSSKSLKNNLSVKSCNNIKTNSSLKTQTIINNDINININKVSPLEYFKNLCFQSGEICLTSNLGEIMSLKRDYEIENIINSNKLNSLNIDNKYLRDLKNNNFEHCLNSILSDNIKLYGLIDNDNEILFIRKRTKSLNKTKSYYNNYKDNKHVTDDIIKNINSNNTKDRSKDIVYNNSTVKSKNSKKELNDNFGAEDIIKDIIKNKQLSEKHINDSFNLKLFLLNKIFKNKSSNDINYLESIFYSIKDKYNFSSKSITKLKDILANFILNCYLLYNQQQLEKLKFDEKLNYLLSLTILDAQNIFCNRIGIISLDTLNNKKDFNNLIIPYNKNFFKLSNSIINYFLHENCKPYKPLKESSILHLISCYSKTINLSVINAQYSWIDVENCTLEGTSYLVDQDIEFKNNNTSLNKEDIFENMYNKMCTNTNFQNNKSSLNLMKEIDCIYFMINNSLYNNKIKNVLNTFLKESFTINKFCLFENNLNNKKQIINDYIIQNISDNYYISIKDKLESYNKDKSLTIYNNIIDKIFNNIYIILNNIFNLESNLFNCCKYSFCALYNSLDIIFNLLSQDSKNLSDIFSIVSNVNNNITGDLKNLKQTTINNSIFSSFNFSVNMYSNYIQRYIIINYFNVLLKLKSMIIYFFMFEINCINLNIVSCQDISFEQDNNDNNNLKTNNINSNNNKRIDTSLYQSTINKSVTNNKNINNNSIVMAKYSNNNYNKHLEFSNNSQNYNKNISDFYNNNYKTNVKDFSKNSSRNVYNKKFNINVNNINLLNNFPVVVQVIIKFYELINILLFIQCKQSKNSNEEGNINNYKYDISKLLNDSFISCSEIIEINKILVYFYFLDKQISLKFYNLIKDFSNLITDKNISENKKKFEYEYIDNLSVSNFLYVNKKFAKIFSFIYQRSLDYNKSDPKLEDLINQLFIEYELSIKNYKENIYYLTKILGYMHIINVYFQNHIKNNEIDLTNNFDNNKINNNYEVKLKFIKYWKNNYKFYLNNVKHLFIPNKIKSTQNYLNSIYNSNLNQFTSNRKFNDTLSNNCYNINYIYEYILNYASYSKYNATYIFINKNNVNNMDNSNNKLISNLSNKNKNYFNSNLSNIIVDANNINNKENTNNFINCDKKNSNDNASVNDNLLISFINSKKPKLINLINNVCVLNFNLIVYLLEHQKILLESSKYNNTIVNNKTVSDYIRLHYFQFVRLYNKKISFNIKSKLNYNDLKSTDPNKNAVIKELIKGLNNDSTYIQIIINLCKYHLNCMLNIAFYRNKFTSNIFKYFGIAEFLFREISLESNFGESHNKFNSINKQNKTNNKLSNNYNSNALSVNELTNEGMLKNNYISKIDTNKHNCKLNEEELMSDIRLYDENNIHQTKKMVNADLNLENFSTSNKKNCLINRTISSTRIIENKNIKNSSENILINSSKSSNNSHKSTPKYLDVVELTNRNEDILSESKLYEELEDYDDIDFVMPNENTNKIKMFVDLSKYEDNRETYSITNNNKEFIVKENAHLKNHDTFNLAGNTNDNNNSKSKKSQSSKIQFEFKSNNTNIKFLNSSKGNKVKAKHNIKNINDKDKGADCKKRFKTIEESNKDNIDDKLNKFLFIFDKFQNEINENNYNFTSKFNNLKKKSNNNLKIQIALEKMIFKQYKLLYNKFSFNFNENNQKDEKQYYKKERSNRLVYSDKELHSLILTLIITLILDNERGILEDDYCSSHPYIYNKTNILYILSEHLNHTDNKYVVPSIASKLINNIKPKGCSQRLLKLLVRDFFDSLHYNNWKYLSKGAYGSVYTVSNPLDDNKRLAIKKISLPQNILDNCPLYNIFSEISALEVLRMNNCVSKLYDYGMDKNHYYIVMKNYKCSIKQWRENINKCIDNVVKNYIELYNNSIKRVKDLNYIIHEIIFYFMLPIYMEIFKNIIESLDIIHGKNITHYDLKCDNVLIEKILNPFLCILDYKSVNDLIKIKICDFGECWIFSDELNEYNLFPKGTDVCKSPEMLQNYSDEKHLIKYLKNIYDCNIGYSSSNISNNIDNSNSIELSTEIINNNCYNNNLKVNGSFDNQVNNNLKIANNKTDLLKKLYKHGTSRSSDIWSLGCMFYELLVGEFLFETEICNNKIEFFYNISNLSTEELINENKKNNLYNNNYVIDLLKFILVKEPKLRPDIKSVKERFKHVYAILSNEQNFTINKCFNDYVLKLLISLDTDKINVNNDEKKNLIKVISDFLNKFCISKQYNFDENDQIKNYLSINSLINNNTKFVDELYNSIFLNFNYDLNLQNKISKDFTSCNKKLYSNNIYSDENQKTNYILSELINIDDMICKTADILTIKNNLDIVKNINPSITKILKDLYIIDYCEAELNASM